MVQHITSRKGDTPPTPAKLAQLAYEHLQEKLWRGALSSGEKISEARLAEELGMSRTPVREAIRRMETEGVLTQIPSSGTYVAVPKRAEIVEAYEVRMAIESFAVRKATRRMKPSQILELQKRCDDMLAAIQEFRKSGETILSGESLRSYLDADLAFHLLLLKAADNRKAMTIFGDVNLRSAIFGCRSHQRDLHHVAWVWRHHARVARAVRQRDAAAAQRWLEAHMQASMEAALEAYDAGPVSPLPHDGPTPVLTHAVSALIAELRSPAR
ncbi:GntR family transcriptional regulator [Verrucomicrobium sp. BvORR106]|uniref:GntR family transcriptional regulator n=1 Tax=Verrucomicrobium sp. BvORR106 TaxID=1403819 RepID=UPI000690217D|nr:GntR family transcriptional regulator [Verrucomicrobium sp. BvORR106]